MRKATSYMRGQRVFTHASSKTIAGVWILDEPIFVADATEVELLGQQVVQALQVSKESAPHPVSWEGLFDPVLKLAGVKSWNTFAKSARCVGIDWTSDQVSFISTENLGAKDGFNDIGKNNISGPLPDAQTLGSTLLDAFDKSK